MSPPVCIGFGGFAGLSETGRPTFSESKDCTALTELTTLSPDAVDASSSSPLPCPRSEKYSVLSRPCWCELVSTAISSPPPPRLNLTDFGLLTGFGSLPDPASKVSSAALEPLSSAPELGLGAATAEFFFCFRELDFPPTDSSPCEPFPLDATSSSPEDLPLIPSSSGGSASFFLPPLFFILPVRIDLL